MITRIIIFFFLPFGFSCSIHSKKEADSFEKKSHNTSHPQNSWSLSTIWLHTYFAFLQEKVTYPPVKKIHLSDPYLGKEEKKGLKREIRRLKFSLNRINTYYPQGSDSLLFSQYFQERSVYRISFKEIAPTVDTTILSTYYNFYSVTIPNVGPNLARINEKMYLARLGALISDSRFTVGVPVNQNDQSSNFLFLSKDFRSYSKSSKFLHNLLKETTNGDFVQLYIMLNAWPDYKPKDLIKISDGEEGVLYQFFSQTTGEFYHVKVTGEKIEYSLVETPQNLLKFIKNVYRMRNKEERYNDILVEFEKKIHREFYFKITSNGKLDYAVYKNGRVKFMTY